MIEKQSKQNKIDRRKLLHQVTSEQKSAEELKKTEEGQKLLQEKGWEKALKKAKGEKVLDNPQLLKKSIKRVNQQKDRSRKKW